MSNIITKAELATYMGKTLNDARAQQVVDAVNAYIENRTGRVWGEEKTVTEVQDFRSNTYLKHMDVTEVTSVKIGRAPNQTTADASSYMFTSSGRLTWLGGSLSGLTPYWYLSALEVTYKTGIPADDVPADLKEAALSLAADSYTFSTSDQKEVKSTSVGTYSVSYASGEASSTGKRYMSVINSYRAPRS